MSSVASRPLTSAPSAPTLAPTSVLPAGALGAGRAGDFQLPPSAESKTTESSPLNPSDASADKTESTTPDEDPEPMAKRQCVAMVQSEPTADLPATVAAAVDDATVAVNPAADGARPIYHVPPADVMLVTLSDSDDSSYYPSDNDEDEENLRPAVNCALPTQAGEGESQTGEQEMLASIQAETIVRLRGGDHPMPVSIDVLCRNCPDCGFDKLLPMVRFCSYCGRDCGFDLSTNGMASLQSVSLKVIPQEPRLIQVAMDTWAYMLCCVQALSQVRRPVSDLLPLAAALLGDGHHGIDLLATFVADGGDIRDVLPPPPIPPGTTITFDHCDDWGELRARVSPWAAGAAAPPPA